MNCHAGSATGTGPGPIPRATDYEVTQTSQGDNWAEVSHPGGLRQLPRCAGFRPNMPAARPRTPNCASCHAHWTASPAASRSSHTRLRLTRPARHFAAEIRRGDRHRCLASSRYGAVQGSSTRPTATRPTTCMNDPPWTVGGGASRLAIDLAWATTDYTNSGSEEGNASAVRPERAGRHARWGWQLYH